MMELLATTDENILYKNPMMDKFNSDWFVNKLCQKTFAGFAMSQIKKIINPMGKNKKNILSFCVVFDNHKSVNLIDWLTKHYLTQRQIGLSKMAGSHDIYAMFVGDRFCGVISDDTANDVSLSSIPKGLNTVGYLSFNKWVIPNTAKIIKTTGNGLPITITNVINPP